MSSYTNWDDEEPPIEIWKMCQRDSEADFLQWLGSPTKQESPLDWCLRHPELVTRKDMDYPIEQVFIALLKLETPNFEFEPNWEHIDRCDFLSELSSVIYENMRSAQKHLGFVIQMLEWLIQSNLPFEIGMIMSVFEMTDYSTNPIYGTQPVKHLIPKSLMFQILELYNPEDIRSEKGIYSCFFSSTFRKLVEMKEITVSEVSELHQRFDIPYCDQQARLSANPEVQAFVLSQI